MLYVLPGATQRAVIMFGLRLPGGQGSTLPRAKSSPLPRGRRIHPAQPQHLLVAQMVADGGQIIAPTSPGLGLEISPINSTIAVKKKGLMAGVSTTLREV